MFAFHCPRHEARRLVWSSDVEQVVSTSEGVGMVFHCSCGFRGMLIEQAGNPEVIVPLDENALTVAA